MEDAVPRVNDAGETAPPPRSSPPPPPDPAAIAQTPSTDPADREKSDEPLLLTSEQWDIYSVSALAALRMFIQALETLSEATGDVPPTPPVSRPTTPKKEADDPLRRVSSPENTGLTRIPPITIGSPEAHPHEPIPVVGANAEDITIQHAAIARRFFSKVAPQFSLSDYLLRLHKYCAHSAGVYLAAAAYCHRLCVSELMVPATKRTIHRLALAAIRIASKALEDNKWRNEWLAKVGGVSKTQLLNLEVALCFLLGFDLWVDNTVVASRMFLIQQAALLGKGPGGTIADDFKLTLPLRKKTAARLLA